MNKPAAFPQSFVLSLTLVSLFAGTTAALAQESRAAQALPSPAAAFEPRGFIGEPPAIERAVVFADRRDGNGELSHGWYTDLWNMPPGAGWISAGPGYRHWSSKDRLVADASAAVSWHGYTAGQARLELPGLLRSRVTLGAQLRLQDYPQVDFFGEGADALESNQTEYRIKSANVVGYATYRPVRWLRLDANAGWLKPSIASPAGFFRSDRPDTRDLFGSDLVFALPGQPAFLHNELAVAADTRDFAGHPTRGGLYRVAAAEYSDQDSSVFSFRRYEAEAAQFVPFAGSRVVLALHGWLVASDAPVGHRVPFYLQPSLGGHNTLRGYADYRFHDRSLLLVNAETRIALMTHVDAAVFVDAGNVAPRAGDLNLDKRSYGAGLRLHSRRRTFVRLDVARGGEGWRVVLRLSDPLDLARVARRTAAIPFVP